MDRTNESFVHKVMFGLVALMVAVGLFMIATMAHAQMAPVPEMDPFAAIAQLVTTWKGSSPWAIASGAIVILVSAINKFIPEKQDKLKRLAVASLALVYGFAQLVIAGKPLVEAGVLVLFTYGGALALYQTIKGIGKAAGVIEK